MSKSTHPARDFEPLSEPASYCDECGRITNRRGNCPDLSCSGTAE